MPILWWPPGGFAQASRLIRLLPLHMFHSSRQLQPVAQNAGTK
ncbi:MAG TPA: hypothetical protein VGY53_05565 [Isosphaeraceae bacterium]|nr:hypothetical protein [Isosphaeraceae bacterium]